MKSAKNVQNLLPDYELKYQRLIDLYLSGEIQRDMLAARKTQLETTIQALQEEKIDSEERLQSNQMTYEEIVELREKMVEFADEVTIGQDGYEVRRRILDILNVEVLGDVENDEKVLYVRCVLTGKDFVTMTTATCALPQCKNQGLTRPDLNQADLARAPHQ